MRDLKIAHKMEHSGAGYDARLPYLCWRSGQGIPPEWDSATASEDKVSTEVQRPGRMADGVVPQEALFDRSWRLASDLL